MVPDIDGDVVFTLQLRLQKPDNTVVLELLPDGPNQNRTQKPPGNPVS